MVTYQIKTFLDIQNAVAGRIGIPLSDAKFQEALKESINTRYEAVWYENVWKFRTTRRDFRIYPKYTAGTVSATLEDRVVIGIGTAWKESHNGWFLKLSGQNDIYQIIGVDVANQRLTLSAEYIGTTTPSSTYEIFQYQIPMPPDCEDIESVWHDHKRTPLEKISAREFIDVAVLSPEREGKAEMFTVSGLEAYSGPPLGKFVLGYDFLSSDLKDKMCAWLYPLKTSDNYILHVSYRIKLTPLIDDSDQPMLPLGKRAILMYGALADMYNRQTNRDMANTYESKFIDALTRLENDRDGTDDVPSFQTDLRRYYSRRRRGRNGSNWDNE